MAIKYMVIPVYRYGAQPYQELDFRFGSVCTVNLGPDHQFEQAKVWFWFTGGSNWSRPYVCRNKFFAFFLAELIIQN
jgi:hypothetical protein